MFTRGASIWRRTARWTAATPAQNEGFGAAVALDGATAMIGRPGYPAQVEVFTETAGSWTRAAVLDPPHRPGERTGIGQSIGLSGATAVFGEPSRDLNGLDEPGAVAVFKRKATGWTHTATLKATGATSSDRFGFAVAVSGSTVVAGAPERYGHRGARVGAAYAFTQ